MYTQYCDTPIKISQENEISVHGDYELTYTLEDGMQFIEYDRNLPQDFQITEGGEETIYQNCRKMRSGGSKAIYQLNERYVIASVQGGNLEQALEKEISILRQLNDFGFYTQNYELVRIASRPSCSFEQPVKDKLFSQKFYGLKMEQFTYLAKAKGMQVRDFKNYVSSAGNTLIFGEKERFLQDSTHWENLLKPLMQDLKSMIVYGVQFNGDSKNSVIVDTITNFVTDSRLITDRHQEIHLYLFDLNSSMPLNTFCIYDSNQHEFTVELILKEIVQLENYFFDLIIGSLLEEEIKNLFKHNCFLPKTSPAFKEAWNKLVNEELAMAIKQQMDTAQEDVKLKHPGYKMASLTLNTEVKDPVLPLVQNMPDIVSPELTVRNFSGDFSAVVGSPNSVDKLQNLTITEAVNIDDRFYDLNIDSIILRLQLCINRLEKADRNIFRLSGSEIKIKAYEQAIEALRNITAKELVTTVLKRVSNEPIALKNFKWLGKEYYEDAKGKSLVMDNSPTVGMILNWKRNKWSFFSASSASEWKDVISQAEYAVSIRNHK